MLHSQFKKDFTIFYKGCDKLGEIKTSKDELIRKLRYFGDKFFEIRYQDEYFIHEEYSFSLFNDFITSIETENIDINEDNYKYLYDLSKKYQYSELEQYLEQYIKERPDLCSIINKLFSQSTNKNESIEIDINNERIISQNLDFCLQNSLLDKLPIQNLCKIITSPHSVIKDHHLLFNFIKKMITNKK